jgi:hypothetical protein
MHSVLPLKLTVTEWYQSCVDCRNASLDRNGGTKDFIIIEAFSYMLALFLLILLLPFALLLSCLHSLPCACFSSHPFCLTIYLILHCTKDGLLFKDFSCWCCPLVCLQEQYNDFHDRDGKTSTVKLDGKGWTQESD